MYLVECYNDETVLRALGIGPRQVRRMKGKGNVMNELKHGALVHVGLVDCDVLSPNPVPLEPFVLRETAHDAALYTWKEQRLVVVEDNIEDWMVKAMKASLLSLEDYLPAKNAAELNRLENRVNDPRLRKALDALQEKKSPHVSTLRRFLCLPHS